MATLAVSVTDLVKNYKNSSEIAVNGISFSVKQGEFFSLLGPNGAGKTTTLSILTTTLSKTSGKVVVAGYDLDKQASQVRQQIGVIFQKPSLDLNLTAEENIRFHSILYGIYSFAPSYSMMPSSYKKKVGELSEILGISEDIFKPVKTFSGGMKRKLEILRGLMHRPKILFLDEPTSGLDPESRRNLWTYLQTVRKTNKTTIFLTTHYLDEAEESDKICIIQNGKIIAEGSPVQIKNNIVKDFLKINSKDPKKLEKELILKKISFRKEKDFIVPIQKKSAQQIIQAIKTPLSTLVVHKPTLEDAYLEIIKS